jgi:hypothetical protein
MNTNMDRQSPSRRSSAPRYASSPSEWLARQEVSDIDITIGNARVLLIGEIPDGKTGRNKVGASSEVFAVDDVLHAVSHAWCLPSPMPRSNAIMQTKLTRVTRDRPRSKPGNLRPATADRKLQTSGTPYNFLPADTVLGQTEEGPSVTRDLVAGPQEAAATQRHPRA